MLVHHIQLCAQAKLVNCIHFCIFRFAGSANLTFAITALPPVPVLLVMPLIRVTGLKSKEQLPKDTVELSILIAALSSTELTDSNVDAETVTRDPFKMSNAAPAFPMIIENETLTRFKLQPEETSIAAEPLVLMLDLKVVPISSTGGSRDGQLDIFKGDPLSSKRQSAKTMPDTTTPCDLHQRNFKYQDM